MRTLLFLLTTALVSLSLPAFGRAGSDCHIGAYRLTDDSFVDIAPSEGDTLRWRRLDGMTGALQKVQDETWTSTFGWTDRPDGKTVTFADCEAGKIRFDGKAGERITFDVTDVTFRGRDVDLAGRLVLPRGSGPVPIVVLVHGAEKSSALVDYALQRIFPAEGVGAFVYDKRGTGRSGGKYTQDFDVLADDAVAAMREARRIAGRRAGRVGYQGGSQAGWIIPLAAARARVDFAIVSFGLAVTVIDEDQQQLVLEMQVKGYGPDVIAKALEVAEAAENVIASRFTEGFERLDAVRAKYRNEPWYKDVHGNYTYMLLPHSGAELRELGKQFDFGTPFHYDPMLTLRQVNVPQLWILGEDDFEAPSAETSRRIKALIAEGRPITLALYPHAEHGMTEYETKQNGERVSTRYAAGYFAMMRDFARSGELKRTYGASVITRPSQ
jgi:pimeloyl-ACP methyl ester carboxylesterase